MLLTTKDLGAFVARSDELGGPGAAACETYWQGVEYRPDVAVDQSLDPFSEAYVEQQLAVYREMSGRDFDQLSNEHTAFDIEAHVAATNPYNLGSPGVLSMHVERLSRALRYGNPPLRGRFLDMGCGWGLSSEVAAYTGLSVTAVDVNPDFVALVNRRAARFGHDIRAQHGTFDTFESDQRFSMILFYECFHHALRPWDLLARMARHLAPEGKIVLAGEPINALWWRNWGLRLDPMSVYCVHKFGWLESGWSTGFLTAAFERAGLSIDIVEHPEADIGFTVIGTRAARRTATAMEIATQWPNAGWSLDDRYLANLGAGRLTVPFPPDATTASFALQNFRKQPMRLEMRSAAGIIVARELSVGRNLVEVARADLVGPIAFAADLWVPDDELNNGDRRSLSVHLESVSFF